MRVHAPRSSLGDSLHAPFVGLFVIVPREILRLRLGGSVEIVGLHKRPRVGNASSWLFWQGRWPQQPGCQRNWPGVCRARSFTGGGVLMAGGITFGCQVG